MAFISNVFSKKRTREMEIKDLVRARGFDEDGAYEFISNPSSTLIKPRDEVSIINGRVVGSFMVSEDRMETLVFDKDNFTDQAWRKICAIMGFKYHNYSDIDGFEIVPSDITVNLSVKTPTEEV